MSNKHTATQSFRKSVSYISLVRHGGGACVSTDVSIVCAGIVCAARSIKAAGSDVALEPYILCK